MRTELVLVNKLGTKIICINSQSLITRQLGRAAYFISGVQAAKRLLSEGWLLLGEL